MAFNFVHKFLLLLITIVVFDHITVSIVYHGNLITVLLIFCFQGGLRNSKHESTLSSQEYVHELRSGITEEKLLNCLESLRVSLTSNPVRSVTQLFFYTLQTAPCTLTCSQWYSQILQLIPQLKALIWLSVIIGTMMVRQNKKKGTPFFPLIAEKTDTLKCHHAGLAVMDYLCSIVLDFTVPQWLGSTSLYSYRLVCYSHSFPLDIAVWKYPFRLNSSTHNRCAQLEILRNNLNPLIFASRA